MLNQVRAHLARVLKLPAAAEQQAMHSASSKATPQESAQLNLYICINNIKEYIYNDIKSNECIIA